MLDRPSAYSKLLPHLASDGRLAQAMPPVWETLSQSLGERLGLNARQREGLPEGSLDAMRRWAENPAKGRAPVQQWLVRLRQDMSMEELLLLLVQLDRAWRQAGWQLGLSAPDWLALSELISGFFEAALGEASASWQGLLAQNHQMRDELGYFRRLASSLEAGQDLAEHLSLSVRETARLLHCEFCAILLPREDERDVLEIRAAVAPRILSKALEGMNFPLAENGLIAQVFLTGAPASTFQPLEDLEITMRRRQTLESLGFSQLLAYPLQTHGRVLGVLCLANRLDDQPWQALEEEWLSTVAAQLSASIRLSQLFYKHEAGEVELATALAEVLAQKDPLLGAHGRAVGALARLIGETLGLPASRQEALGLAGDLHDLGFLMLPDAIRLRPGPLWSAEAKLARQHPVLAAQVLEALRPLKGLLPAIRHHHERWDGQGYPDGLKGQAIPLEARIIAVADAYCTLTVAQTYQPALPSDEAWQELKRHENSQFDSVVVQALREVLRRHEPDADGQIALPTMPAIAPAVADGARPEIERSVVPGQVLLEQAPRLVGLLSELAGTSESESFHARFWQAVTSNCAVEAMALWQWRDGARLLPTFLEGWRAVPDLNRLAETGLESYAAACRVPVATPDLATDARFKLDPAIAAEGFVAAMALPLVVADRLVGVLSVYRRGAEPFLAEEQTVLELASAMLAVSLESQDLQARHRNLAATDPLTGVASHRTFMDRVGTEIKRAEKYQLSLCALLIDLDAFGAYNEANGYGLGDEVLAQVGSLLKGLLRPADLLARYEGDSFAALLPESSVSEALALADQLRLAIAASQFPSRRAGGAKLTASVGVTMWQAGHSRQAIVHDLKLALARAREEGENRLLFHAGVGEGN